MRNQMKFVQIRLFSIVFLIIVANAVKAQTGEMTEQIRPNISDEILKESELVLGPSLSTAENMLIDKNQIYVFGIFMDSLNQINSAIFDEFGSHVFTKENLIKITKTAKEIISKDQARMIAIVGEGSIFKEEYSNGIKDAIIVKIFHKDTNKVIDYIYPFTRQKGRDKFVINISQGLRFVTE